MPHCVFPAHLIDSTSLPTLKSYAKLYHSSFPVAVDLVERNVIDVKRLITHTFNIKDAQQAFETTRTFADNAIKVQIEFS